MNIILVLLYVINGVLMLETKAFKSPEECLSAGKARIEALQRDPKFDGGAYAGCLPSAIQEIKKVGEHIYGL